MEHLNQIVPDKNPYVKTPREAHDIGKLGVSLFLSIYRW